MNLLRSIITSDWFVVGAIVWCIMAIANRDERHRLMKTVGELIKKPFVFQVDPNPESNAFYARQSLETIAKILTSDIFGISYRIIQAGGTWRKRIEERFSKDESSFWKMLGSVVLLALMIAFLYADLIAIFTTLEVLGLVLNTPPAFRHYEYAVTLGSFFTIVLAGLLLIEIFGRPIFTDIANQTRAAKLILTWVAVILIFSGLAVAISLGLIRYSALTDLGSPANADFEKFYILVITILVPANTIISTFLIVSDAMKGIPIVGFLIVQGGVFSAAGVLFIFGLVNYLLWFGLDVVYRVILMSLYLIFFFVLTPLDSILAWKPFSRKELTPTSSHAPTTKNKQT
jgi:hypothetical protein